MKRKPTRTAEGFRDTNISHATYGNNGVFRMPGLDGTSLMQVVVSDGEGWDHVSVSLGTRTPTWLELEHVKQLFFRADETVMQLHVPDSDHVNCHPFCLHLWRPQNQEIPRPPRWMVGPD